jgi:hypothetical protein
MASHSVYTFFSVHNCLDADFDAPDVEADAAFCRAVVDGRYGLHPEAWSSQTALTAIVPLGFSGREDRPEPDRHERVYHPSPADLAWEAQYRRRPVVESPVKPPKPRFEWMPPTFAWTRPGPIEPPPRHGELQLTCDECAARFDRTQRYAAGRRQDSVNMIRAMGRDVGWTCIVGRDRCPRCSLAAAPEAVGNGTGEDEGHKQHTNGGG